MLGCCETAVRQHSTDCSHVQMSSHQSLLPLSCAPQTFIRHCHHQAAHHTQSTFDDTDVRQSFEISGQTCIFQSLGAISEPFVCGGKWQVALGLKKQNVLEWCQLQVRFIWCLGITVRATCSSQVLLRGEIPFCEMVVRASTLHQEQPTCERRKKHYFAQRWTRLARTFLCGCCCQRVEVATWCPPLCLESALSYFAASEDARVICQT